DDHVKETLSEVRKVGANYEEHQQEAGLDIPVDLVHFKKFPVVDPPGTYKKMGHDTRSDISADDSLELPDYSGPFNGNLRFSDFSKDALVNLLELSDEYYRVCIEGWADSVAERYGRDDMQRIQAEAWQDTILPQLRGMIDNWMELTDHEAEALIAETQEEVEAQFAAGGVVLVNPYKPRPDWAQYSKERLVKLALGSHEYLLAAIESWALAIVMRDGLDEMFAFQWTLWSEELLPAAKDIKSRWMGISGDTVEAFMKDIQVDATSFPGKAFEMTFEMPEKEVGIFTFNKCVSVDQWEAMGRPDIAEKASHTSCPAAIIETAKMYNPNMKVEILAIPPRVSKDEVCCKWRLSIRDESDPEYVRPEEGGGQTT
ncbi:MAG: hypothetical protein P4L20_05050, partial [Acidimicrobiales bacterium]|nr:hypothetical protein [Acidimicrobiales bacterium]